MKSFVHKNKKGVDFLIVLPKKNCRNSDKSSWLSTFVPFVAAVLMCAHTIFLQPYIILASNERTNLFTPLLAAVVLGVVYISFSLSSSTKELVLWERWEPWAWIIFCLFVLLSGYLSAQKDSSICRAISLFLPAASGYWCGRILSANTLWSRWSPVCFTGLFLLLSASQIFYGSGVPLFHGHHHAFANMLLLFAVGPVSLFSRAHSRGLKLCFAAILLLGFAACYLIGSRFIILLPFVLLPILLTFKAISLRSAVAGIAIFLAVSLLFFVQRPDKVLKIKNYESVFYRVEGIPAALHIMKQSPLFGIGLRASRAPYLEDYTMFSGLTDKKTYMEVVQRNVTEDNMLTTMIVGVGLLPTSIYIGLLLGYGRRLRKAFKETAGGGLETTAIGLCLAASLIHFSIQDGLLSPQINWFFHLLVGSIPLGLDFGKKDSTV